MTISSDDRVAGPFSGNGTITSFPFEFQVFADEDVTVILTDDDGVESTLVLGTHYTVTLNADQDANPGGTVDTVTAPATGEKLTVTSSITALQPVDLTNQGGFYPRVITRALDRLTILIQQLKERVDRSLAYPISDAVPDAALPRAADRAGKYWYSNITTGELEFVDGVSDSGTVSFLQSGVGAITRSARDKMREMVSVKDFGAVGDGVADDTAAIQGAANYANSIGGTLYAGSGTYKITATVTITCNCDMSAALFNVNAASVPIGIIVGSTTSEIRGRVMSLPRLVNTAKVTTGWTGFSSSVGVDIANLFMSKVTIPSVLKFGIGVDVGGYTTGNAYNNIFIGELFDNKISLRIRKKGASGYSNQNAYYGGQYGMSGAEGTAISGSYGVSLESTTNNNTFINPSLEAGGNEYQIRFSDSSVNVFVSPRLEITGGGRVHFNSTYTNGSSGNIIYAAYDVSGGPLVTYSGSPSTTNKVFGSYFGDYLSYSTKGLALINTNGNGPTQPHVTGWDATTSNFLSKNAQSATDWSYKLYAEGLQGKRSTDATANVRIHINFNNGQIKLGDGSAPASATVAAQPTNQWLTVSGVTNFLPIPDNSIALGTSGYRWTVVYATTGTINTSDEREKQDIENLSAAEKKVAARLKGLIKKYRWKDAVKAKGDLARIHIGVIAQDVIAAFAAENLDPMKYAIVCKDEWSASASILDDDGNVVTPARSAGERYGVRYDQLLAFIIGAS